MTEDYRFRVAIALLRGLAELRLLSQGLVRLAAEKASEVLAEGIKGGLSAEVCLERLLGRLDVKGRVEAKGDEVLIGVKNCPFCLDSAGELCPLPFLLALTLARAVGVKAYPLRVSESLFVAKGDFECEIRLRVRRVAGEGARDLEG